MNTHVAGNGENRAGEKTIRGFGYEICAPVASAVTSFVLGKLFDSFFPYLLYIPESWAKRAILAGAALAAAGAFFYFFISKKRFHRKAAITFAAAGFACVLLYSGVLINTYEARVTRGTVTDTVLIPLRHDYRRLRFDISGDFNTGTIFSIELVHIGSTNSTKLDINGLPEDTEIDDSRYYRPQSGSYTITGNFKKGDQVLINKKRTVDYQYPPSHEGDTADKTADKTIRFVLRGVPKWGGLI